MPAPEIADPAAFAIPGILDIDRTASGLEYLTVRTPAATATLYLQGAHLARWQPSGHRPVLFLSPKTDLVPGKPIRGGVPISFPWFAVDSKPDRLHGRPGPSHGFARTEPWTLAFAGLAGDDLHLTLTLGPSDTARSLGFDRFRAAFHLILGRALTMRLTVANEADVPLVFEEALHTYFAVSDVRHATVTGLESTPYLDKTAGNTLQPAAHAPIAFTAATDRVYNRTAATCTLHDPGLARRIVIEKTDSATTVVFNPFKPLPDLPEDAWPHMLCVETANAVESPVTLAPAETHTLQALVTVEDVPA